MSTAWVECWKCDECGFRWIKTETWPERCASSKCRKRSWNKNAGAVTDVGRTESTSERYVKSAAEAKEPQPAPFKMNPAMAKFMEAIPPKAEEIVDDRSKCKKIGWNESTGDGYRCRLAAGHKGNCAPGERIDA